MRTSGKAEAPDGDQTAVTMTAMVRTSAIPMDMRGPVHPPALLEDDHMPQPGTAA